MSEMVERVAKAIERTEVGYHLKLISLVDGVSIYALTYDDDPVPLAFSCIDDGYAHIAEKKRLGAARAAIEAMREPTEEMTDGLHIDCWGQSYVGEHQMVEIWQTMIGKALK